MNKIHPNTEIIGKKSIYLPTCHSTNDIAHEIIQNSTDFHGTVILTDHQIAGRGQRGTSWLSEKGENLLLSIALDTSFLRIEDSFYLSKFVAICLQKSIQKFTNENVKIKWPNDILIRNKKVAGILIENKIAVSMLKNSVVGIGVNVMQKRFESPYAGSLIDYANTQTLQPSQIAEELCETLEKEWAFLKNNIWDYLNNLYKKTLWGWQERRFYYIDNKRFEGVITQILDDGKIEITTRDGRLNYGIKEVKFEY
ncbi:MAG: biotin--[acetyl-CoA-carboxylase] ligase [Leadbetterella sp.]